MGKLFGIFIAFLISLFLWNCDRCGGKLFNGDCGFCLNNSNALREFEEEDE
jgi:hypothetical protein